MYTDPHCLQYTCLSSSYSNNCLLSRDVTSFSTSSSQQQAKKIIKNNKDYGLSKKHTNEPSKLTNSFLVSVRDRHYADFIIEQLYYHHHHQHRRNDYAIKANSSYNVNNGHSQLNLAAAKYLHALSNYQIQSAYQQNIVYYNNLLIALAILFVLFTVLLLLEDNEAENRNDTDETDDAATDSEHSTTGAHYHHNLSAISFLLFVTFNLLLIIFTHYSAKQLFRANASAFILV